MTDEATTPEKTPYTVERLLELSEISSTIITDAYKFMQEGPEEKTPERALEAAMMTTRGVTATLKCARYLKSLNEQERKPDWTIFDHSRAFLRQCEPSGDPASGD